MLGYHHPLEIAKRYGTLAGGHMTEAALSALEERLRRVEDELAINEWCAARRTIATSSEGARTS